MAAAAPTRDVATLAPLGAPGSPLEQEWAALHDRCAADPFLHPGVVRAWAAAFGGGELTLATVRRDGELTGALPLTATGGRLSGAGNWHTVRQGLLALDGDAAAALAAAPFAAGPRGVTIELLDGDSLAALRGAATQAGFRTLAEEMIRSPYMEISGSYDEFVAGWSSKRRSEHRRLRRKLEERGAVTVETATAGADATRLYGELLELEAQGWKAARGTAIAQQAQTRAYYAELVRWGGERGWLRLDALRLDGRAVAVGIGLEAHGVFYGIKMGADPELRKVSPAVLLLDELVRRCCDLGLRRFEMLGADDDYKRQWCDGVHERARLRAFGPSLRGRLDHAELVWARPLARRLRSAGSERVARLKERRR